MIHISHTSKPYWYWIFRPCAMRDSLGKVFGFEFFVPWFGWCKKFGFYRDWLIIHVYRGPVEWPSPETPRCYVRGWTPLGLLNTVTGCLFNAVLVVARDDESGKIVGRWWDTAIHHPPVEESRATSE